MPSTLMDQATKAYLSQPLKTRATGPLGGTAPANFKGYKLPWAKGLIGYAFNKDGPGHISQIDFDIGGLALTGDVLANKPGTVVFAKQSSNSGACSYSAWKQANIVVVQTAPSEYAWYVHLAYYSVPVHVGDTVTLGTKLGVEGTTGFACGTHVHFMVSSDHTPWTNPVNPNDAPWSADNSLAPTDFDEVSWAAIVNGNTYVSQNAPGATVCMAPALQTPADGALISASTTTLAWSAPNNCTFDTFGVRVKTVSDPDSGGAVLFDGQTQTPSQTLTINPSWNYQDVFWSVRASSVGAAWATRRIHIETAITGTYTLFDQPNFAGAVLTGSATITNLTTVNFANRAQSLKLDPNVGIVLCTEVNLRGDCARALGPTDIMSLTTLSPSLLGNVNSLRVCAGACLPAPLTPTLQSPVGGAVVLSGTPVVLKWQGGGDAFDVEVSGGALSATRTLTWANATQRSPGALAASDKPYHWRVRAANAFGTSPWAEGAFLVVPGRAVYVPVISR